MQISYHFIILFIFFIIINNIIITDSYRMKIIQRSSILFQNRNRIKSVPTLPLYSTSSLSSTVNFSFDENIQIIRKKPNKDKKVETKKSNRKIISEDIDESLVKRFLDMREEREITNSVESLPQIDIKDLVIENELTVQKKRNLSKKKVKVDKIELEGLNEHIMQLSESIEDSSEDELNEDGKKKGEINYILFFDGGSRSSNCSGCGITLYKDNIEKENEIWSASLFFSSSITSNTAEYFSIVYALKELSQYKIKNLLVYGDSRLVINQINKEWNINFSHLKILNDSIQSMLSKDCRYNFIWIPREKNTRADELANLAMDEKRSTKSCDLSNILPLRNPSIKNKTYLKNCEESWNLALQVASFSPLSIRN